MKTGRRGRPAAAGIATSAAQASQPKRPRFSRAFAAAAIVALVLGGVFVARESLVKLALTTGFALVSGDRLRVGSVQLGPTASTFEAVSVTTRDGDPLFDADRVALVYSVRDALTNRSHRYGLSAVTLERPVISIVRHADGSYNLAGAGAGGGAPGSGGGGRSNGAAWNLGVHIRDGELRLLDRAPVAEDLGRQAVTGLNLGGQIRSDRHSALTGDAQFVGRRTELSAERSWPLKLHATVDYPRGIAMLALTAGELPVRGILGFVQHSAAVRVDDGLLREIGIHIYALDIQPDRPPAVHLGGAANLSGGRLTIAALAQPVRDMRGRLTLLDDGVWSARLDASLAGIPLVARGGAFDRFHPTLRLGVRGAGDLRDLRTAFAFARKQPVSGPVQVETLLEAPVSNLLIRSAVSVTHGRYARVPLSDVRGRVDYHAGTVVLDGVRGRYGAAAIGLGARFLLGGPALDSAIVATGEAPGRAIPFTENVAPEAGVGALAIIRGGVAGYRAHGALGLSGGGVAGTGMFAVDESGVGEFGPFVITRRDGSSVIGALRLERPSSQSAAWISARNYRIAVPPVGAHFAGLNVPGFPPVAGVLDADLAGGGPSNGFALTGSLRGRDLRVGAARLGTGRAELGGRLADLRIGALAIDGPLGRFAGSGAAADGMFALRGRYDGSLQRLVPLTGNQEARGPVHGNILATLGGANVVVQSPNAVLGGGSIHGVAFDTAAGTIAVRGKQFHLVVASGVIGGRRAVAAESHGTVALSAPDIPSSALRGTGLPLDAGNVSAYGVADLREGRPPTFEGTIAVAGGRAHGYRVAGDAQIDLDGARARVFSATGALGATFGSLGGSIDGIGVGALRYDVDADVPLGDIDLLRRDLSLPVRHLAGTFAARLHVHGSGARPFVDGRLAAPEGTYNGLAFRDGSARVVIDRFGIAARDAALTVGSTRASIAASAGGGAFAFAARSPAADLADFNDYFDASDTLAGRGPANLTFRTYGQRIDTAGGIALAGVRYRDFDLGQTDAVWRTAGGTIAGSAHVRSPAGRLDATASIQPAPSGEPRQALLAARYDAHGTLAGVELGSWILASGSSVPILGRLDAQVAVHGRYPNLAVSGNAALSEATVAGYTVPSAHLRASGQGSRIEVSSSDADLGFAKLSGSGRLGLAPNDPLAFDLRATTDDVSRGARALVPAARGADLAGALDATVRISGSRAAPQIAGGFDLHNARYRGFTVPRAIGEVGLVGRALELRDADVEFTRGQAFVAGSLPLTLRPFGLGPPHSPLSFDVTARGVDLAQFAPLLPPGTKLGGTVDGRFGVEGSVDQPRLFGALAVAGGSYISPFERAPIEGVAGNVEFAGSSVALRAFHAGVGGGTLDGSGRITLPIGAGSRARFSGSVTAKSAKLDFPAYGRGTVDGVLNLSGTAGGKGLVAGTLTLRDAVIPVSAVYGTAPVAGANAPGGLPFDPAFQLRAIAGDNVRIRSSIVDIGVSGAVDVHGTLRAPQLAGEFAATDGTISSYNHVFRLVNAVVTFNPADGAVPTIAARAMSRVVNPDPDPSRNIAGSANIIVTVSGTADSNNLQVTYSSEPAYSQEQIIGLLLDVPALLGAVNFNLNGGPGDPVLRGAPGETNALLPPGVTPEQVSAISFNQEVFSLLNGQLTQRALSPIERTFQRVLGLSDVQFTVDYGGGIGYALRRQIGKRDFYAFLSQTVSYPERSNIGFELQPKPFESINFSFYQQNGVTSLITNQTPGSGFLSSTRRLTSVQPLGNRAGVSINVNRRF